MANAKIEGYDCTLFYDYDCYRDMILPKLTDDGKIKWLELRMRMIFLRPLEVLFDRNSSAFHELESPSQDGSPRTITLMAVSLLMNGIEALGSFLTNLKSMKKENFCAFMDQFMPDWTCQISSPQHGKQPVSLSKILWDDYRNGLAHSFAIGGAGVDAVQGKDKFKIDGNTLQIDIWKFFSDFKLAVDKMFSDVSASGTSRSHFLSRFADVYNCK